MRIPVLWAFGLLPLIANAAPATVLEHTLDVQIGRRSGRATQSWTVRVDDPDAVAAGLLAPPGLAGSQDGEARILEGVVLFPSDVDEGDTFTFQQQHSVSTRADGGVFQLAPDLVTETAHVQINGMRSTRLLAWADDTADFRSPQQGTAQAEWTDATHGVLSWSTWSDWNALGASIEAVVVGKLATRAQLGRDLSSGAATVGESLAGLTELITQRVDVAPGDLGTLDDSRDAAEVLQSGSGTATERALVLLSMLRELGFDARFGYAQPGPIPHPISAIPPTIQGFSRPAVAVVTDERIVWIDPASDHATPPDTPAAFATGSAWATGLAPIALPRGGGAEGEARVVGSASIGVHGDLRWEASITARGPAQEHLRRLLADVPPAQQEQLLADLITRERADSARVDVQLHNVGRYTEPLRIRLQVVEPNAFTQAGPGRQGVVQALVAPALAAWMPPGIDVIEDVRLRLPDGLTVVGTPRPTSRNDAAGLVSRTAQTDGNSVLLHTEARQQRGNASPEEVARFFGRASRSAVDLLAMPPLTRKDAKAAAKAPWLTDPVDETAMRILLAARAGDMRGATKHVLKRDPALAWDALVWRISERSDAEQYQALDVMWDAATTDAERIDVATALTTCCGKRSGWLRLSELVNTPEPQARVEVLLSMLAVQPSQAPSAQDDPAGHQAWFEPEWLIEHAEQAHREAFGDDSADPRILRIRATQALASGDAQLAETVLIDAMRLSRAPDLPILYAQAGTSLGVDVRETMLTVEEAVANAPDDPDVLLAAADVLDVVGLASQAVDRRHRAARLLYSDTDLWLRLANDALDVSDLATALDAAKRASELDPRNDTANTLLSRLAWMAGDQSATDVATARLGNRERPVLGLEDTLDAVAIAERAAVLEYRDEQTRQDPSRLADRGLARLSRGHVHDAALDGLWLQAMGHNSGDSIVAAATMGRMTAIRDTSSDNDVSAALTLTRAIVLGSQGGPASARLLEDNATAATMRRWFANTQDVIGPYEAPPLPSLRRPNGYSTHAVLSGAPNTRAWTLGDAERAIVITSTPELPPPLSQLVQRVSPAERRILGGVVERLTGLDLPVYAACVRLDGAWAWGLGFTTHDAEQAARDALQANPRQ